VRHDRKLRGLGKPETFAFLGFTFICGRSRRGNSPLSFPMQSLKQEIPMNTLFSPVKVGPYQLSHRVAMAPLTCMRFDPGDIPSDLMVEYYTQRASKGGLIISEATPVPTRGNGYAGALGIYSNSQIAGRRRVTDAVHANGGRIFLQLWHVGRQSQTDLQPEMRRLHPPRLRRKVMPIRSGVKSRSPCCVRSN
jgi:2,4-dienoyl-CoA reductase-like NADH-dependent reductase (Old Yellow Enzyme family)